MRRIKSAIVGFALLIGLGASGCGCGAAQGRLSLVDEPGLLDTAVRSTVALVDPDRGGRVFCAGVYVRSGYSVVIVTAAHCTMDRDGTPEDHVAIAVGPADAEGNYPVSFRYEVISRDVQWDVAILSAGAEQRPHIALELADDPDRGDRVVAIGHPYGLVYSLSEGIVAYSRRTEDGRVLIQVTAPVHPGNSGGPLVNTRGELVGICSCAWMSESTLGGFVPASIVRAVMDGEHSFTPGPELPDTYGDAGGA